ncbi:uncharacterized protein LOC122002773 isoform X2 [Zingiber officinale]|uniref:uncharacterized protein LOC122002773 isoform X2 n=1 Tax=Zingiber officinale TaxID=94328 RepID=UPI001C4C5EE8|nr:uncharacterized protein LOC122002773 isoform X2 [Zingiber officinale]
MDPSSPILRNSYWVLRHGRSIPNEKGLVVSSLENGTLEKYGLASEGFNQARLAGELFLKEVEETNILPENVQICYSPFSRTTDTAKTVANVLGIPFEGSQCKALIEFRERYFGPLFELHSHEKYSEIWALDEKDPFMPPEGGESVADVASRIALGLAAIETEFQGLGSKALPYLFRDACEKTLLRHPKPLRTLYKICVPQKLYALDTLMEWVMSFLQ